MDLPSLFVLAFGQLLGHEGNAPQLAPIESQDRYFNLAHCACSQRFAADPGYLEITYALAVTVSAAPARPGEIWVGQGCDDAATRAAQCHRVDAATIPDLSAVPPAGVAPEVPIIDLMEPEPSAMGCDMRAITGEEWAIADLDGDGVYDSFTGMAIATDALPPPLPIDFSATYGPGVIELHWTPPADTSDIYAYQALCATDTGDPARVGAPPPVEYVTARQLCGEPLDVPLVPSPIVPGDNTDVAIPQTIAQLDPSIVCGETLDPNASALRIDHLREGPSYVIALAVVDRAANAAVTYFHPTLAPGGPTGGCCDADGSEPPIALVLALLALRMGTGTRSCRRSGSAGTTPSAPPPRRTRRAPDPASATR